MEVEILNLENLKTVDEGEFPSFESLWFSDRIRAKCEENGRIYDAQVIRKFTDKGEFYKEIYFLLFQLTLAKNHFVYLS